MKLFYFTPFYPPQNEAAATRSYWFIKTLETHGHQVEITTSSNLSLKLASNKDSAIIRLLKEHLVGMELFLKIFNSPAELIILSSPPFFTVCWGAFAAIIRGKRYILDVRDLYPEVFFEMGLINESSFLGRIAKYITRFIYLRSHNIMTVTDGLVSEIKKYSIHSDKITLARNGYDPERFYPGTGEKFEKTSLVFHGTIGKAQNVETLLKLASALENDSQVEILVAGDGPKLKNILEANRKNIRYLGNLKYEEVPDLLRKCHVGLSFRTDDKIGKEAFPVKVFEYIGCGLPVILAPKGEAGDMVESDGLGFQFENNDIFGMVKVIQNIKNYKHELSSTEHYTRSSQSLKILSLLH